MNDSLKALDPEVLDPDALAVDVMTMVNGRAVKPGQMEAFRLRQVEGLLWDEIVVRTGNGLSTMYKWRTSEWWKQLTIDLFEEANAKLRADIIRRDPKLVKFYEKLLDGKLSEDKSTAAGVKAMGLRMEVGPNPIINRKGSLHVDTVINNSATIVVNRETTKDLSQSDLLKIITGEMPVPEAEAEDDAP